MPQCCESLHFSIEYLSLWVLEYCESWGIKSSEHSTWGQYNAQRSVCIFHLPWSTYVLPAIFLHQMKLKFSLDDPAKPASFSFSQCRYQYPGKEARANQQEIHLLTFFALFMKSRMLHFLGIKREAHENGRERGRGWEWEVSEWSGGEGSKHLFISVFTTIFILAGQIYVLLILILILITGIRSFGPWWFPICICKLLMGTFSFVCPHCSRVGLSMCLSICQFICLSAKIIWSLAFPKWICNTAIAVLFITHLCWCFLYL